MKDFLKIIWLLIILAVLLLSIAIYIKKDDYSNDTDASYLDSESDVEDGISEDETENIETENVESGETESTETENVESGETESTETENLQSDETQNTEIQ